MTGEGMIKEALDRHTEEEIINYLYALAKGVLYNYNAAMKSKSPEILYGSLGDVTQMYRVLKEIDSRNAAKIALNRQLDYNEDIINKKGN